MTKHNIILNTDSYKASMFVQMPEGTQRVFSYIESRGGKHNKTVFFGLQAFIKEYLLQPITAENINEAEEIWLAHGEPFNREGWEHILNAHNGYLPIRINAVPEGTIVPTHNVLVTVENTDDKCFWLTTWLETALLRAIWFSTTVATNSWHIKQTISKYLDNTGGSENLLFKLHDFSKRGVSSYESSMLGGMSHLVNFMGTDTISAIVGARLYYNEAMAGYSIPAAEHSTITSWGREHEVDAYRNMLRQFAKPGSLVAVVSDSYDIYNAVEHIWGEVLRQEVIDSGATVVIRPDSGDPVEVVSKVVKLLDSKFGSKLNKQGFKLLNNVRVIQGDGINADTIEAILKSLKFAGYSADNVAFGMGGALTQMVNRDDQRFAMKASAALINDNWIPVYKDPVTDSGKRSKRGRLGLQKIHGVDGSSFQTLPEAEVTKNELQTVFENGKLLVDDSLAAIRSRTK